MKPSAGYEELGIKWLNDFGCLNDAATDDDSGDRERETDEAEAESETEKIKVFDQTFSESFV